ncbi:MAG: NTP transferase domain-containing protein [bacterium JZ-2024 1]
MVSLGGIPIFCHALRVAQSLSLQTFLIVAPSEKEFFQQILRQYPEFRRRVSVREDARRYRGPLPALAHFARSMRHPPNSLYLVLSADMPGVHPNPLRDLISSAGKNDAAAVFFFYRRSVQPFPSVWRCESLRSIRVPGGLRGLSFRAWIRRNHHLIRAIPLRHLPRGYRRFLFFANINAPEDLLLFARPPLAQPCDSNDAPSAPR